MLSQFTPVFYVIFLYVLVSLSHLLGFIVSSVVSFDVLTRETKISISAMSGATSWTPLLLQINQ